MTRTLTVRRSPSRMRTHVVGEVVPYLAEAGVLERSIGSSPTPRAAISTWSRP